MGPVSSEQLYDCDTTRNEVERERIFILIRELLDAVNVAVQIRKRLVVVFIIFYVG